ncbi:coagulation factor XIII B chain-like isoform X1 [Diadema antillarum]|uniref:coagulation factor XIII B chain-like isoform X1 n=1 Tax=Diadema antillarum TaxID=105358 RepID=UPI003A8C1073
MPCLPGDLIWIVITISFGMIHVSVCRTVTPPGLAFNNSCDGSCHDPGEIENGYRDLLATFPANALIEYGCDNGYHISGQPILTCISGIWNHPKPACKAQCVLPTEELKARNITMVNVTEPDNAWNRFVVNCSTGYNVVGSNLVECVDGQWFPSLDTLHCEATCTSPPIANFTKQPWLIFTLKTTYDNGSQQTIVEVACPNGTTLIGSRVLECLNGKWFPLYDSFYCQVPCGYEELERRKDLIFNSTMSTTKPERQNVLVTCAENYELIGSSVLHCVNGQWFPPLDDLRCGSLDLCENDALKGIPNLVIGETSPTTTLASQQARQTVHVTCAESFVLIGSSTLQCIDGQWFPSPGDLCCERNCPDEEIFRRIEGVSVSVMNPEDVSGGIVLPILRVECAEGYSLVGPERLLCVEGEWFPAYNDLLCARMCVNVTIPPGCETDGPPTTPRQTADGSVVLAHGTSVRCRGRPLDQIPTWGYDEAETEMRCFDGTMYNRRSCQQPTRPIPETTEVTIVDETEATTTVNSTVAHTKYFSPTMVALSCVSGGLFVILLIIAFFFYRLLRRRKDGAKQMKKSGFRNQLSIFQRPSPESSPVPPKLPSRPMPLGSVGSLGYSDQEKWKLPGQKIAEEEEEERRRREKEAMQASTIYEQIGRKGDQPEYIDVFVQ